MTPNIDTINPILCLTYITWFAYASVTIATGSWGLHTILSQLSNNKQGTATICLACFLGVLSLVPLLVFEPILQGGLFAGLGGFLLCYSFFMILAIEILMKQSSSQQT